MRFFLAAALSIFSIGAQAAGLGCQDTLGPLDLEKIRTSAVGTQIIGCINRSFDTLSNALSSTSFTASFGQINVSTIAANGAQIYISSPVVVATLDVQGNAQFGSTSKSTFSTTGALTMAAGTAINLFGSGGVVVGQSSITTGGSFFGDGSHLTGIPSTASIVGVYVQKTGDSMSGPLTLAGSTLTVTGNAFSVGSRFSVSGGSATVAYQLQATSLLSTGQTIAQGTMTVQGNAFSIGGSTLVASGGQVLIGTTSDFSDSFGPHSFVVSGPSNKNVIGFETNTQGTEAAIYMNDSGNPGFQWGTVTNTKMGFFTDNNSPQLVLDTGGGVEVGVADRTTIPPSDGLLVSGSVIAASTLTVQGNAFSVGGSSFSVSGGSATLAYGLTAASFSGDGSRLTGIPTTTLDNLFSSTTFVATTSTAVYFSTGTNHYTRFHLAASWFKGTNTAPVSLFFSTFTNCTPDVSTYDYTFWGESSSSNASSLNDFNTTASSIPVSYGTITALTGIGYDTDCTITANRNPSSTSGTIIFLGNCKSMVWGPNGYTRTDRHFAYTPQGAPVARGYAVTCVGLQTTQTSLNGWMGLYNEQP